MNTAQAERGGLLVTEDAELIGEVRSVAALVRDAARLDREIEEALRGLLDASDDEWWSRIRSFVGRYFNVRPVPEA